MWVWMQLWVSEAVLRVFLRRRLCSCLLVCVSHATLSLLSAIQPRPTRPRARQPAHLCHPRAPAACDQTQHCSIDPRQGDSRHRHCWDCALAKSLGSAGGAARTHSHSHSQSHSQSHSHYHSHFYPHSDLLTRSPSVDQDLLLPFLRLPSTPPDGPCL